MYPEFPQLLNMHDQPNYKHIFYFFKWKSLTLKHKQLYKNIVQSLSFSIRTGQTLTEAQRHIMLSLVHIYCAVTHAEPQHRWPLTVPWIFYLCESCPITIHAHAHTHILPSFYCSVLPFFSFPVLLHLIVLSLLYLHFAFSTRFSHLSLPAYYNLQLYAISPYVCPPFHLSVVQCLYPLPCWEHSSVGSSTRGQWWAPSL